MRGYHYSILVILLICQVGFGQNKEYLIYNSDTIQLIIEEEVDSIGGVAHQSPIGLEKFEFSHSNYWEIKNDSLFRLIIINGKSIMTFMSNWNGILYSPDGKLLHDFGLTKIYIREKGFVIEKGIVIDTMTFDNSSTVLSPYSDLDRDFYNYLIQSIDTSMLDFDNCKIFIVEIEHLSDQCMIQEVKLLNGCDQHTNQELLRVIKTIPQWSKIYLHGKITDYYTIILIDLNKLKRWMSCPYNWQYEGFQNLSSNSRKL